MKIELKEKNYWEVASKVTINDLFPGRKAMIKAIKQLTPILVDAIPEEEIKRFHCHRNITKYFPNFLDLFDHLKTPVRGYEIVKSGSNYKIEINCFYNYSSYTLYAMPVSYLPRLKETCPKLHKLIVLCLGLLQSKEVPIIDNRYYDEDDWIEETTEEYLNMDNDDKVQDDAVLQKEYEFFKRYKNKYLTIIKRSSDPSKIRKAISEINPKTEIEKDVIKWAEMVIDAFNEPLNIDWIEGYAREQFAKDNDIEEDKIYNDGNPVELSQVMRVVWFGNSFHTNHLCEWLEEMGGNFGSIEFHKNYQCKTFMDIENSRQKFMKEYGLLPEKLAKLLEFGANMFEALWGLSEGQLLFTLH